MFLRWYIKGVLGRNMYTYDTMLSILNGYRRIGEQIERLSEQLEIYTTGYSSSSSNYSMCIRSGTYKDVSDHIADKEQLQEHIQKLYSKHRRILQIVEQFRDESEHNNKIDVKIYILDMCYFLEKANSRKNKKYIPIFVEWANCNNIVIPTPYDVI